MSKSIKNDADIMLLISQHFSNVSVTESHTVFRVASKERKLHKPRLWANMDLVKVQTGTSFDVYMFIYNSKIYPTSRLKLLQSLVFSVYELFTLVKGINHFIMSLASVFLLYLSFLNIQKLFCT